MVYQIIMKNVMNDVNVTMEPIVQQIVVFVLHNVDHVLWMDVIHHVNRQVVVMGILIISEQMLQIIQMMMKFVIQDVSVILPTKTVRLIQIYVDLETECVSLWKMMDVVLCVSLCDVEMEQLILMVKIIFQIPMMTKSVMMQIK